MRIVIDMQGAQTASRFRGIGRYVMSFTQALVRNRGEHEVILVLSGLFPDSIEPIKKSFLGLLPKENIRVWHAPGPVRDDDSNNSNRRDIAEVIRESFLSSFNANVILITSLFEGFIDDAVVSVGVIDKKTPVAIVFYDLIPLLNPDDYLKPNPAYERHYLRKINFLCKADCFLAISESSKSELIKSLTIPEKKVANISAATDDFFKLAESDADTWEKLKVKFGISKHFILYTGASDARKNINSLIDAYSTLPSDILNEYQLVLGGGMDINHVHAFKKRIKSSGISNIQICFTGHVSDNEMLQLYSNCDLYVFPSVQEGFGLPVLEAMTCGAPVIGSNVSSIPEVIGSNEALFDPFDVNSIREKIIDVITNEALRSKLIVNGINHSKSFSWDKTATKALDALSDKIIQQDITVEPVTYSETISTIGSLIKNNDNLKNDLENTSICLAQNSNTGHKPQILVDISELIQRDAGTGIQRVVRNILQQWLENPPLNYIVEPIYANTSQQGYRYAKKFSAKFFGLQTQELQDDAIDYQAGDIFLGLDLQPQVQIAQADFYQLLRRHGVKVSFIVFDLLCYLHPHFFMGGEESKNQFDNWLHTVAENDEAICISKSVADEFNSYMLSKKVDRLLPFKTQWFHLGADIKSISSKKALYTKDKEQLSILKSTKTFLMVGTVEPRKGHAQTLDAFEKLWHSDLSFNLVIVGKQGWMVEDLVERIQNHKEFNNRLFWLEGINDEYLEELYKQSNCLIAASYGEGFGLPLIEAAQYKLPIIARDIPVFREVAGEHAYYFEGTSTDELANKIQQWVNLYNLKEHPKSDKMPWLTWQESAKNLLNLIIE